MFVSLGMLFMIVLASMSVGCCVGIVVMVGCKVSVRKGGGCYLRRSPPPRPMNEPPYRRGINLPPSSPRPAPPPPQRRTIQESEG